MFNATEFIYDGIYSEQYGLKIASFNSSTLEETPYVTPSVIVGKSPKGKKYHYIDCTYENPPTHDFSVVSEKPIHEDLLKRILLWLDSRKGFKKLVIMQQGLAELTYNCIFTVTSLTYHAGKCVGLNLSATFDSIYAMGVPSKITFDVYANQNAKDVSVYNYSDVIDGYVYPMVELSIDGAYSEPFSISIVNSTDDQTRIFSLRMRGYEKYTIDNELKIIKSNIDWRVPLENFNKKWLRLRPGENKLKVSAEGNGMVHVTITCPRYVKITF